MLRYPPIVAPQLHRRRRRMRGWKKDEEVPSFEEKHQGEEELPSILTFSP
jgi:hypothetical protein